MSETIQTKQCSKCKKIKPVSEFYPRKDRSFGYYNPCKSCKSIYKKQYCNSEKGKKILDNYLKKPGVIKKRKISYKKYIQSEKGKKARYKIEHSIKRKISRQKHKHKETIRHKTYYAVRTGVLPNISTRRCAICGNQANEYHHYNGYKIKHYLDIIPLCYICHSHIHHVNPDRSFLRCK